jgi:hypothetical protein
MIQMLHFAPAPGNGAPGLTVKPFRRYAVRSTAHSVAGRQNPERVKAQHSANPADSGAFFMPEIRPWRAGRGTRKRGRFAFTPVSDPRSVRLPTAVRSGRDGSLPQ